MLLLAGLVLLGVAQAIHAAEHWEIASRADCVAHAGDTSPADNAPSHDHGCTLQDHAPAVAAFVVFVPVADKVTGVSVILGAMPVPPAAEIEHPPQLS